MVGGSRIHIQSIARKPLRNKFWSLDLAVSFWPTTWSCNTWLQKGLQQCTKIPPSLPTVDLPSGWRTHEVKTLSGNNALQQANFETIFGQSLRLEYLFDFFGFLFFFFFFLFFFASWVENVERILFVEAAKKKLEEKVGQMCHQSFLRLCQHEQKKTRSKLLQWCRNTCWL